MFGNNTHFKVGNVTDKGKYAEVECSTSKKSKFTGKYETDFSSKYVRFIGEAYKKNPQPNERIKVTNCGVQNVYQKDGKNQYQKSPTYMVFDFERENGNAKYTPSAYGGENNGFVELEDDGSLPF